MVSINQFSFTKIFRVVFEKIHVLFLGVQQKAPLFWAIIFIFTGHRSITAHSLDTEYEQNSFDSSGARDAHIHPHIHAYIQTDTRY
jgi:hypothetical protein